MAKKPEEWLKQQGDFEMAENKTIDALLFMKERLQKSGVNIRKIILFGSQVESKVTEDSDIDLIIISDDFRGKDIFTRAQLTKDAEITTIKRFMIPLDVITMTPEELADEDSLLSDYAKNGQVIYAA